MKTKKHKINIVTLGCSKRVILQLGFFGAYLLVSAGVIIMWYFFPVVSLIFFLFISIFHFGCGDLDWKKNKTYLIFLIKCQI